MRSQKRQACEYHLTILHVRMKVKFPCRMKIEYLGTLVTGQTPISGDNKYIFNQEIILKDDRNQECFEFVVNLVTEIGSKYIAGVIKLYHSQLVRSQGQKLVLSLSKCIDTQAFCQIRVDKVRTLFYENSRSKERRSSSKNSKVSFNQRQYFAVQTPKAGSFHQLKHVGSLTQYQYPSANTPSLPRNYYNGTHTNQRPQSFKSPVKIQDNMYQMTNEGFNQSNKFQYDIEQSGYKQAYLKLKQKFKKEVELLRNELNKKSSNQNNQNVLKLELMKYKIKMQELERASKDKANKFHQSSASIHKIRQLQLQNNYLSGQIKKRDDQILRLEDTIQSLTCDLQELTQSLRDKKNDEIIKTKELKLNNQSLKQKLAQRQKELQYLRQDHQQILKRKQEDFSFKNIQLQKDRKLIIDLQKNLQNKIIQSQKALQKEKAQNKQRLQEELSKIENLQKQNGRLIIQRQQIKRKLSQAENSIAKEQYERKLLRSECENLRTQCSKNKEYRDKYYDVFNENKILNEKIIILQGQIDKLVENKNENNFHLNKQSQDQIQYFKKLSKQSEDRVKSSNNRISQLQNLINQNKIQYEKMRRVIQSVNQQLNDSKQKEKTAKRHMRQKQNNSMKMQEEYTILKQRVTNIDQFYNAQIDKIKGESKAAVQQLQIQKNSNAQLQTKLQSVENELKDKTEKLEQVLQKAIQEQRNNTNNSIMVQQLKKNLQINERQFNRLTEHCQKLQKQEKLRLQEIEQNLKVKSQKVEKLKKDLKDVQQKYFSQAHNLKNKSQEIQSLTQLRANYQQSFSDNTQKIKILEVELIQAQNEKLKLTKMNEFFQEEINKYKQEIKQTNHYLQQSQKRQMELKEHLATASNEINQFSSKLTSFKKQYERFKQGLVDLDTKYFSPLLKDEKETKLTLNQQTTFNELLLSITGQYKEVKHCFAKKQQQIALQKKQNESLRSQIKNMVTQTQNLQTKMKEQNKQLLGQIQQILYDKSLQAENFTAIINQLKKNIEQKQAFEETLHNQIEQLNFNINSVKMDFQAANDFNTKKINQMRKISNEFQLKLQEKQILCQNLEQKIEFQAQEIAQNTVTLQQFHEINTKQQKQIEQIKQILQFQRQQYSAMQNNKKQLSQKVNELEFILTSTKDENEKIKKNLEEEQAKSIMLNNLVSNLMKEKENGIKKQLEGSYIMTDLQNTLLQKEKSIEMLLQHNKTITINYQSLKETVKNVNSLNKQLQAQLKQLKSIHLKSQEKLTQKEKFHKNTEQGVKKNISKYQKIIQNIKNQKIILQEQLQTNRIRMEKQIKFACERISELLKKVQEQKAQNQILQKKYIDIEQQMFQQHQKITQQEQTLNQKEKIIKHLDQKIEDLDRGMNQLNEELKIRDQKLFGLSDQNYNLELRIQEEQKYRYEQLQRMALEQTSKYENMCEDYQNRIETLQNEAKNLKGQSQNLNQKLIRKDYEIKRLEQQQVDFKKLYQQKIKKMEQDKSTTLLLKNAEIQKLNDQIKHINQAIKQKQTENRRLLSQLQNLRKTTTSNEYKLRESEQKNNQLLKQQRQESEQYRKKESELRIHKQSVQTYKWNMERQMKKLLQSYVKNFMQITEQKNSSRVIDTVRSLQISIFEVINQRQNQIK